MVTIKLSDLVALPLSTVYIITVTVLDTPEEKIEEPGTLEAKIKEISVYGKVYVEFS